MIAFMTELSGSAGAESEKDDARLLDLLSGRLGQLFLTVSNLVLVNAVFLQHQNILSRFEADLAVLLGPKSVEPKIVEIFTGFAALRK